MRLTSFEIARIGVYHLTNRIYELPGGSDQNLEHFGPGRSFSEQLLEPELSTKRDKSPASQHGCFAVDLLWAVHCRTTAVKRIYVKGTSAYIIVHVR